MGLSTDHKEMFYGAGPKIFELAKQNRKSPTKEESILWEFLKNKKLGYRFKRQHPINRFIADYYCHKLKLVVEIDGGYHLSREQKEHDEGRSFHFEEFGITVIRFTNDQVNQNTQEVVDQIAEQIVKLTG